MKEHKIFGLGLSRTGTTSLGNALTRYGFRTIHYPQLLFAKRQDFGLSNKCAAAPILFKSAWTRKYVSECVAFSMTTSEYMDSYDAFVDLPVPILYKQLWGRFPNAKFIYTKRDPEKWLNSMRWLLSRTVVWGAGSLFHEINYGMYQTKTFHRGKLLRAYETHEADVHNFFADKPAALLTVDISQEKSVARLLRFLGVNDVSVNDNYPMSNARYPFLTSWYVRYRHIFLSKGLQEPSISRWLVRSCVAAKKRLR